MYCYQCGAKAILAEAGILKGTLLVAMFQLVDNGLSKHSLAFAVDKHYLGALALDVGVHHLAELVELHTEHVGIRQAGSAVEQFVDVQVALNDALVLGFLLWYRPVVLLLSRLFLAHGALQLLGIDFVVHIGDIVVHKLISYYAAVEIFVFHKAMGLVEARAV